ncbi:MAG: sigma-70 family RNA polymerase sigma factor [Phenylobacterium sp.]
MGDVVTRLRETRQAPAAAASRRASERALAELYRANIDRLRSYLTGILKSEADADDVAQEAFLRLHRCGDLSAYNNPRAVLFKTAYRLALNCLRGRRSNPLDRAMPVMEDVATAPEPATTVEEALIAREQERAYGKALASLPPRCRQVIELRTVQELSYKEMSDTLGLSVSTLEKHIVKGKRVAAEALAGWWEPYAPAAVAVAA